MADHPKLGDAFRHRRVLNVAMGLGAIGMLSASAPAYALSCGDVLAGSTATLDQDLVCERSPALIAEGPVVLDLQGFTLACALSDEGALIGTGIEVIGSQAEVRNGQIENCRRGVHVKGDGQHLLKDLSVTSSAGVGGGEPIGFLVQRSDHNRFIRNTVRAYAGEGFRLDGANNTMLKRNKAIDNGDHGFRVRRGQRNVFLRNQALRNGGEGFRSQDRDNRFDSNTAIENGDEGIRLRDASAQNNLVTNNTVEHNGLSPCNPLADVPDVNPGIAVTRDAKNNKIKNNTIKYNCIGIAIEKGSRGNQIKNNKISKSRLLDMADANKNCGNNDWRKNKFKTSLSGPFPPGIPLHPCMRYGRSVTDVADQASKTLEDGISLAKDGGSAAKDAGSAVKDAAKSLF